MHSEDPNYEYMSWPSNYYKLACATMFTLFFGGDVYAPRAAIEGQSLQKWLQSHYIKAYSFLASQIKQRGLTSAVIGFQIMNEPSCGMIGCPHIGKLWHEKSQVIKGSQPTFFQGMQLGMGNAVEVEKWTMGIFGPKRVGSAVANVKELKVWQSECIWAQEGVWDATSRELLRPNYFYVDYRSGKRVDFWQDFWTPFAKEFCIAIRQEIPEIIIFLETGVMEIPPVLRDIPEIVENSVWTPHWYDGPTLIGRQWQWLTSWVNIDAVGWCFNKYTVMWSALKIGYATVRKSFCEQIGMLQEMGRKKIGIFNSSFQEILRWSLAKLAFPLTWPKALTTMLWMLV